MDSVTSNFLSALSGVVVSVAAYFIKKRKCSQVKCRCLMEDNACSLKIVDENREWDQKVQLIENQAKEKYDEMKKQETAKLDEQIKSLQDALNEKRDKIIRLRTKMEHIKRQLLQFQDSVRFQSSLSDE